MGPGRDRLVTPFLWLVIGAGLGVGSLEIVAFPLLVLSIAALSVRAARSRSTRSWADLAGLLFGAGLVAFIFVLPDSLLPSCPGGSYLGSGGCEASGRCWSSGPTSCTDGHLFFAIAAGVASLFMLAATVIVVWRLKRASGASGARGVS